MDPLKKAIRNRIFRNLQSMTHLIGFEDDIDFIELEQEDALTLRLKIQPKGKNPPRYFTVEVHERFLQSRGWGD